MFRKLGQIIEGIINGTNGILQKKKKKSLTLSLQLFVYLDMNCKNCNTTDFVGTIFYPNLCIPCIIKLKKIKKLDFVIYYI